VVAEFWTERQSIIMGKTKMTDTEELRKKKRRRNKQTQWEYVKQPEGTAPSSLFSFPKIFGLF